MKACSNFRARMSAISGKISISKISKAGAALLAVALLITLGAARVSATTTRNSAASEALLNKQVHHQLVTLPWFGVFDNLEYSIHGSEVILSGQVVRPITKSDAEASVKKLEGVTRVVNNITVLPLSPFDNQLRRAEFRAIFSDESLNRYSMGAVPSLHIIVDNGHVILEGVVGSEMDRNLANIRANSVPNVFSVTNNLRVG